VRNNIIIAMIFLMLNGGCSSVTPGSESGAVMSVDLTEEMDVCSNEESLINSLQVQEFDVNDPRVFDLLGIKIFQSYGLRLVEASRISGSCAGRIDEFSIPVIHFDTGVVLMLSGDKISTYPKDYYPVNFIVPDDAHPVIPSRHFIQAISMMGVHRSKDLVAGFIGAWGKNGGAIITPYKKKYSGAFHVYDDLIELGKTVIGIRFMGHLHGVSGTIQLLLEDGEDRLVMSFIWNHWGVFIDDAD